MEIGELLQALSPTGLAYEAENNKIPVPNKVGSEDWHLRLSSDLYTCAMECILLSHEHTERERDRGRDRDRVRERTWYMSFESTTDYIDSLVASGKAPTTNSDKSGSLGLICTTGFMIWSLWTGIIKQHILRGLCTSHSSRGWEVQGQNPGNSF